MTSSWRSGSTPGRRPITFASSTFPWSRMGISILALMPKRNAGKSSGSAMPWSASSVSSRSNAVLFIWSVGIPIVSSSPSGHASFIKKSISSLSSRTSRRPFAPLARPTSSSSRKAMDECFITILPSRLKSP